METVNTGTSLSRSADDPIVFAITIVVRSIPLFKIYKLYF